MTGGHGRELCQKVGGVVCTIAALLRGAGAWKSVTRTMRYLTILLAQSTPADPLGPQRQKPQDLLYTHVLRGYRVCGFHVTTSAMPPANAAVLLVICLRGVLRHQRSPRRIEGGAYEVTRLNLRKSSITGISLQMSLHRWPRPVRPFS